MHYYTLKKYLKVLSSLNLIILDNDENSYILDHKVYYKILGDLKNVLD